MKDAWRGANLSLSAKLAILSGAAIEEGESGSQFSEAESDGRRRIEDFSAIFTTTS